ncbi:MAG TPA: aldo/keto reductase [Actinocrinis sp.]|nr:aldo/keto reductase [Actinocrinis sp.]
MRTLPLGSQGLTVSAQGLGCMGMSAFYGQTDDDESLRTLARAAELGVTFLDTADMYGLGANEELVARFLAQPGRREQTTLATKFAITVNPDAPGGREVRGDAPYVRQAAEASLKRLGVDTIDLYYMHRRDVRVPIEETVGAMADLVAAGKVRYLGLSEVTAEELRAAHAVHPISALQSEWSLFTRGLEESIVPAAVELGVGIVPYSPLGRGFLAGHFTDGAQLGADDFRTAHPRFSGENAARNAGLLAPVQAAAQAHAATVGQVALAWVHHRTQVWGTSAAPIPGTKRVSRLEENAAAADLVLTEAELASLEGIAAQVAGDRYADMQAVPEGRA